MNVPKLEKLASRLAHLSQLLSAGAALASEADSFYATLGKVMDLPAVEETLVQAMAIATLEGLGDDDSRQWLSEELDVECTLQQVTDAGGRERASLLFALPVVLSPTDTVSHHADLPLLEEVHEVLEEADVVSADASFGLVNRLFSYQSLFGRSYGQLKRLNIALGEQVLQGVKTLVLPEDFPGGEPEAPACSEYANLCFVVGVAVTRNSDLENVFPPLVTEEDDMEGGFEPEQGYQMTHDGVTVAYAQPESGLTSDGRPWEEAFCQAFDDAWGAMDGSLTVLPPDGICEDLRRGLEVAREVGTTRMFDMELPLDGRDKWARVSCLQESEGKAWFDVSCLAAPEVEPVASLRWTVFNHECAEESLDKLVECLEDAGVQLEGPSLLPNNRLGSMLLH